MGGINNGKLMVGVGIYFALVGAAVVMFGERAGVIPWLAMVCGFLNFAAAMFAFWLAYTRER